MKYILSATILIFIGLACSDKKKETENQELIEIDSIRIAQQLERMVKKDQEIQFTNTSDKSKEVRDSLFLEMGRIFETNTDTIKQLFKDYGFLGFDKVGKQGSQDFWLLVQHADHEISFQEKVLNEMLKEVKVNNADGSNYAYLMDRVLKNKGLKQLYGTQVKYIEDFWIIPQPLKDSVNVDKRRKEVGLAPIKEYLNEMMELHYEMNKGVYEKNELKVPRRYK